MAISESIGYAIGLFGVAASIGTGWVLFCVGLGIGTALEKAQIRYVVHKRSREPHHG